MAGYHTCGLLADGTVNCWGAEFYGLTEVPPGVYTAVSAQYSHACGLLTDGSIRCWGYNDAGQTDVPGR